MIGDGRTHVFFALSREEMRFMKPAKSVCLSLIAVACLGWGPVTAEAEEFNLSARGFYLSSGFHIEFYDGYLTGWESGIESGIEYRSFFVFDIPESTEFEEGATLSLWMPVGGFSSNQSFETITAWEVLTPVADLLTSWDEGDEGKVIFEDLGSGEIYGSTTVMATETGAYFTMVLNATAVAALNASAGNPFAFGVSMTSLVAGPDAETAFANTATGDGPNTGAEAGRLNTVPEPTVAMLVGLSVGGLFFLRRRSRRC